MESCKKKNIGEKMLLVATGAALTVAGLMFIPSLIQKYGNKAYKVSLNREVIDFDNMGPEIVPNDPTEEEE